MGNVRSWPIEHVEFLRMRVIEDEHSMAGVTRLINDHFGASYTRSSVIGKVSRMGLATKREPAREREPTPRRSPSVSRTRLTAPHTGVIPVTTTVNAESKHITLYELEDGMCKWITAVSSETFYCGVATGGRRITYCACHQKAGSDPTRYRGRLWSVSR